MRRAAFLGLMIGLAAPAQALGQTGAGTASAAVLRLDPAPGPLALGGAYAALAEDPMTLFYNPARLDPRSAGLGMAFQTLPLDAGAGSIATAFPAGPGTVGLGTVFLDYGEVDVVEPDPGSGGERGVPTGERVGGGEVVIGAGYALPIGARLRLGLGLKLLRIQIAEAVGTGMAVDAGASMAVFGDRLVVSLAVQNLGPEMGAGRAAPLPTTVRLGTALRFEPGGAGRIALGVEASRQAGEVRLAAGLESGYAAGEEARLVARLGYRSVVRAVGASGAARDPVVFGAGLRLGRYTIDYAHRPLGPLGTTHLFGMTIHSGR